jgi:hypothetical protein
MARRAHNWITKYRIVLWRCACLLLRIAFSSQLLCSVAHAEMVLYLIPGTKNIVSLQGKTTVNPGGTVSFRHARFGNLVFGLNDVRIYDVPTNETLFQREYLAATKKKDADKIMPAAQWALNHGMLKEFHAAVDEALKLDPKNAAGRRVRYAQAQMAKPLGESEYEQAKLVAIAGRKDMKIKLSAHFALLYDTPDEPLPGIKLTAAEERLQLLEMVYQTFLMKFFINNVKLEVPSERLMVVLFSHEQDYLRFIQQLDPALQSASGFWDPTLNVSVFYAQGTSQRFKKLNELSVKLQNTKREALRVKAANTRDIVRAADTISLLVEIAKENDNVSVVSHEATHHLAGNTGLLPRGHHIPTWVHEGLATYFEAPKDAVWSGIGAVNEERLDLYRELERDTVHSNIDFITENRIFTQAADLNSQLHGYGQSWALTHFLMERHFDQLVAYYRALAKQPEGEALSAEEQGEIFREIFGKKTTGLEAEWRAYMNGLQTDLERIIEPTKKK